MASKATLHSILLVFCISVFVVQGRILRLNSSDFEDQFLISDGVDQHRHDRSSKSTALGTTTCRHQYNFLPCAENIPGYIFLIIVYQLLLKWVEGHIHRGSEELFNIIGKTKVGSIIFRFLMALPSMIFMILSGAFSSKENAQSTVSVGVGIFAGITVFSLTFQWGIILMLGSRKLKVESNDHDENSNSSCLPGRGQFIKLKDDGVRIDEKTRKTGGIMLLSLIPYAIVQLVNIFPSSSANRVITIVALIVSVLLLGYYFLYQVTSTWMQERSLAYAKYDILKERFLEHVQQDGQFLTIDGEVDTDAIRKVFAKADTNQDKSISMGEGRKLVQGLIENGKMPVEEEFAFEEIMTNFDFDKNGSISEKEFVDGCINWINEIQKSSQRDDPSFGKLVHEAVQSMKQKKKDEDPVEIHRIMTMILTKVKNSELKSKSLITEDGKPDVEGIKSLFKQFDRDGNKLISRCEVQEIISSVEFGEISRKPEEIVDVIFEKLDGNGDGIIDESEFEAAILKAVIAWQQLPYDRWTLVASLIRLIIGAAIMTLLGGPLMNNILSLSYAVGLPSFSTSFVIVPITLNLRALAAAIVPAKEKNKTSASLTFSEIYSSVIMNNIVGLTSLLFIVFFKGLTWNFSAEVLTILFVCATIGVMAYKCDSYPLWTSIVAILLYPASWGFYYLSQVFWGWN